MKSKNQLGRSAVRLAVAVAVSLNVITMVWPTWIEAVTGADPDSGDGSTERWLMRMVALASLSLVLVVRFWLLPRRRPMAVADHG
jgi:hypothetical protein